jgi:hypothetical protein
MCWKFRDEEHLAIVSDLDFDGKDARWISVWNPGNGELIGNGQRRRFGSRRSFLRVSPIPMTGNGEVKARFRDDRGT